MSEASLPIDKESPFDPPVIHEVTQNTPWVAFLESLTAEQRRLVELVERNLVQDE
jgi:hypothetical protein